MLWSAGAVGQPAILDEAAVPEPEAGAMPRHSATVRVTHWLVTAAFFGLLVSGIAILLAHPRLYWGETGGLGGPSLIDLPIPLSLGHSGWGRSLHFLSGWICVLTGIAYLLSGFVSGHLNNDLMPAGGERVGGIWSALRVGLRWSRPREEELLSYNPLQRLAYAFVIFLLFPVIALSGLAMSPAITSVVPELVESFGGQQSARTVHFFASSMLVCFVMVHVGMVCRPGFVRRMRGMITGSVGAARDSL